jgi:hypothetical protein
MSVNYNLPPAFDPILLDAMPDTVSINRYVGDDDNGNPSYGETVVTRANIVVSHAFVELRLGKGARLSKAGEDFYVPAPVTMATIIIPAQGTTAKDEITFTVENETYSRYVALVQVNRDQFGQPWTENLSVQITKE